MNIWKIMLSIVVIAYFLAMSRDAVLTIRLLTMILLFILFLLGFKFLDAIYQSKPPKETVQGRILRNLRISMVLAAVAGAMVALFYGSSMLCAYFRN